MGSRFEHTNPTFDIISKGVERDIWHLYDEGNNGQGRTVNLIGKELINFGSCSYLGLDYDPRLIEAVISGVRKYGTQLSSSRTYLSSGLYLELETLLRDIFINPVVVTASTTLGHLSAIPVIVGNKDVVILDQSVHASIQQAVQTIKARGVTVDIIRHNNLEQLEEKIIKLRQKYDAIWYMADGIYSMYGEECPIDELYKLLEKYPQLHLYIDDAHGLSWAGKHGSGFILSKVNLHPRMILTFSMHKGFGSVGGIIVCPNEETAQRIKYCGSTMVFSGPINPPMIAAGIASAKIHLSDEIYELQKKLEERVSYANKLAEEKNLPFPYRSNSPIIFVGVGRVNIGYSMTQRLMEEGYFTNLAVFPAVPVKNTGLRICATLHHKKEDYKGLFDAIEHHLPLAIEEDGWTRNKIQRSFGLPNIEEENKEIERDRDKEKNLLKFVCSKSIKGIPKSLWDNMFHDGVHNWEGLNFLEEVFKGNPEPENNWDFYYYTVYDNEDNLILATVLSMAIWKDDMLAREQVSQIVEDKREGDSYYLTSKVLSMGTLISEGNHLFLNKEHPLKYKAINELIEELYRLQEKVGASKLVLRDFDEDTPLKDVFVDKGFIGVKMPDNHAITLGSANSLSEYVQQLSKNSRKYFKKNIFPYEAYYDVQIVDENSTPDIDHWIQLYKNVKAKNLELNTFELPRKMFQKIADHPELWDIIELRIKPEYAVGNEKPVAVLFSYKSNRTYCPLMIGIDYNYNKEYQCYRQAHYQALGRAIELKYEKIKLGFLASIEKQRLGASKIPTLIFAQNEDNFSLEALEIL